MHYQWFRRYKFNSVRFSMLSCCNPFQKVLSQKFRMNLQYTRLWIMQELWLDQHQPGRGREGLTADQLADKIRTTTGPITSNSVRTAVKELIAGFSPPLLSMVESLHQTVADSDPRKRGGLAPRAYKIDQEAVITWPCTAKLVLRLQGKRDSRWLESTLVEEIHRENLTDPDTGKPFTKTKIMQGVKFAVEHGYIQYVQGDQSLLTTTDKVAVKEKLYLEFLTRQI
jgi:hypothetical protein